MRQAGTDGAILDALPANIALLDSRGVIVSVNDTWRRFALANAMDDADGGVGRNYLAICEGAAGEGSSQAREVAAGIRSVLDGTTNTYSVEYPCHSAVQQRWFQLTVTPLSDDDPAGAVVMHQDITERRQALEVLRESEERFSGAFEYAPIGVALVSLEGRWLKVNRALCDLLGYSEAELLTRTWQDITHRDDLDRSIENARRTIAGEAQPLQIEKRYIHKHGFILTVLVSISLIGGVHGRGPYFVAQIQDVTQRKLVERALRDSDQKFQQLADNITDAFWIRSADMTVVHYVSPAFERIWGRPVANLYDNPHLWSSFILAEDRDRALDTFATLTGDTPSVDIEYRIVRPGGEVRWIRARGFQVRDDKGTLIRNTGIVTDITEQHVAAEALRTSEAEFRTLAEAMPQIVWVARAEGGNFYLNQQWVEYTGLTLEEGYGEGWDKPVHPDDRQRSWNAWQEANAAAGIYSIECRLRGADGAYRWWLVRGVPLKDEAGHILKWLGTCTDIHDLKVAELQLSASERRFTDLLGNVDMVSLMLDTNGRVTYCNDYMLKLTGWRREDLIGEDWFARFVPPRRADARAGFMNMLANRPTSSHHENEILTRSGEERLIQWNNTLLRSSTGEVIGSASIGVDLTARRLMESQLRQAQKMEAVGQLAAGVAHEFNNLLQALLSMSAIMRFRGGSPETAAIAVEIESLIKRGAGLTQQLLLFSRHEPIEKANLNVNEQVEKASALLRHLIPENVSIAVETSPEPLFVEGDAGQIQQVLLNLAINARDAMTAGGTLTLRSERSGHEVFQDVEDTGHGIDESTRARLFEPFFTTKEPGKGTGLGLAVAQGIVEQHGGRIEVRSTREGSRFRVVLPLSLREDPPKAEPEEEDEFSAGAGLVLLVEDDAAVRAGIIVLLELIGYEVIPACSGEEAIAMALDPAPEFLLSDVTLPGITGPQVAGILRERFPSLRVVLMSGYVQEETRTPGLHFLQKPFELKDLAHELRVAARR